MMMSSSESYIENIPIFQSFGEKKECIWSRVFFGSNNHFFELNVMNQLLGFKHGT
jgi:hypothetical protein